jgi:hypothetical protein
VNGNEQLGFIKDREFLLIRLSTLDKYRDTYTQGDDIGCCLCYGTRLRTAPHQVVVCLLRGALAHRAAPVGLADLS